MKKDYKRTKLKLLFFVFVLALFLGLNYSILKDYGFLDANELIYTARRDTNFQDLFIVNGRPLFGLWCKTLYAHICTTIADLKWSRLFALVCCVLFSTQIFNFLLNLGLKFYESLIFALLVLALPTMTVYYSWSSTSQIPMLLVTNFFAGQLLLKVFTAKKIMYFKFGLAFLIVFASMFFYQSAVMVFLLPILFYTIVKSLKDFKIWLNVLAFTLTIFLCYYISFKLIIEISGLEAANRTSLNLLNTPKRILKFYYFEFRTLLKNSGFLVASRLFLLLGFLSFIGFLLLQLKQKTPLLILLGSVLILPFSYAPNILSGQSYFSLRTIAPAAIIVLFYQFWFFKFLVRRYHKLKLLFLLVPLFLLALSAYNQNYYVAGLQAKEYKAVKEIFDNFEISKNEKLTIVRPKYGFLQKNGYYKNGFADEFGNLSSVKDWSPSHLFSQLKWEQLISSDNTLIVFPVENIKVLTEEDFQINKHKNVIKLTDIFHEAFSK